MKYLAYKLAFATMVFTFNSAISQNTVTTTGNVQVQLRDSGTVAKQNEGFDKNNLPGQPYDIGLPPGYGKPPKLPKDPTGNPPEKINGDISVQIRMDGPIIQDACSDYFTVNYIIIAKSSHVDVPITFPVTSEDNTMAVLGESGINNFPERLITLDVGDSRVMTGSLRVSYPYAINSTKGSTSKQYLSEQLEITAKCFGGFHDQSNTHYILYEANKRNNQDTLHITTPLPLNCIKVNSPQN